jgi:hypothetical protein
VSVQRVAATLFKNETGIREVQTIANLANAAGVILNSAREKLRPATPPLGTRPRCLKLSDDGQKYRNGLAFIPPAYEAKYAANKPIPLTMPAAGAEKTRVKCRRSARCR